MACGNSTGWSGSWPAGRVDYPSAYSFVPVMMPHAPVLILCLASLQAFAAELSFNRDIRPILSENCFACHGFDSKKREAGLRLDIPEGAFTAIDGLAPIAPGDPAQSTVWQRITSTDEDDLMPPPDSHKKLNAAQKETIRQWIAQGAPYQKHWAFEKPVKPDVPSFQSPDSGSAGAEIDAFIHQRLAAEGLAMSPEADKPTLIRRAAFALTGLPPSPEEVAAFEKDTSPKAYEAMVDRYLKSPRHGEEMARHWLDIARYADTHGLHLDNERSMWAYRDWVIRAFNDNLPFDDFTVWQIAGDQLPNATPDQVTATGFSRCNVTTSEGGSINEEFLFRYAVDRAATLTETWMGLTGGCAVCHDHKYDPLTAKDFYSLYAFFYSAADPPMDGNIALTQPVLKLPAPDEQRELDTARQAEAAAMKALQETAAALAYADPADITPPPKPETTTQVIFDDDFLFGSNVRTVTRNPPIWDTLPAFGVKSGQRALRQESSFMSEARIEPKTRPVVIPRDARFEVWVRVDPAYVPDAIALTFGTAGIPRVFWGDENVLVERFAGNDKARRLGDLPKAGEWTRLSFTLEQSGLKSGDRPGYINVQQAGGMVWWDHLTVTGQTTPAEDPLASFRTWWKAAGKNATVDVPGPLQKTLTEGPGKPTTPAQRAALLQFYLAHVARTADKGLMEKRSAWEAAVARREAADDAITATLVFRDLDEPRAAFLMERGDYTKPTTPVEPATPAFLPPLRKAGAGDETRASRLDLARWLVSPEHPLTARVYVNRLWQQLFGLGLVKTSHDFGSQGDPPTHPDLLDWLAVTFMESGWDVRALVKQIVMSRAFRQQSVISPELLDRDPENRLLARGPRFRLDAEQIRDNALFVSGLIDFTMGGRGVRPYQPPNIWEPVGYQNSNTRYYLQDHGGALYRRSIYTFLKRTAPPPFMDNFDAPNREQSCSRRERSNTPLQALQLMNDVQHFEAARALAERVLSIAKDDAHRIQTLFQIVLARSPDAAEESMLTNALAKQRQLYHSEPRAAMQVVGAGESGPKQVAPPAETAAWTLLANLVLNLDETLTRN